MENQSSHKNLLFYKSEIERLEALFEHSSFHFQSLDAEGFVMEVNSSWLKALGYSREEVVNTWFGDLLSPESKEDFIRIYQSIGKEEKQSNSEFTLKCKDGSKIYTVFNCIANFDSLGKLQSTHCIFENVTKLRNTEQALTASEKKYARLVELSNIGIYEFDLHEERFIYINEVIRKVFGLNNDDELKVKIGDLLSREGQNRYLEQKKALLNGDSVSERGEFEIILPDGRKTWIELNNRFVYDGKGKVKVIGAVHNISQRKKLEMKLRNYYKRLEQITGNLPSVIFQLKIEADGLMEFEYFSKNVESFFGYTADKLKHNSELILERIDPDDLVRIARQISASKTSEQALKFTYSIKDSSGSARKVSTSLVSKKLDNSAQLYTGISNDITEEFKLKKKLKLTELRYENLVNSASPAISTMSKAGIVLSVNPRLCELSGYKEGELIGKHFVQIPMFYAKDIGKYTAIYKDAIRDVIPVDPVVFRWKHKSGEQRWAEAFLGTIKDNGRTIGYQAVMNDITERVRQEKLEKDRKDELNFLFDFAINILGIESEKKLFEYLAEKIYQLVPGAIVVVNSVNGDYSELKVESVKLSSKKLFSKALDLMGNNIIGRSFIVNEDAFKFAFSGRLVIHHETMYDLTMKQVPEASCKKLEKLIGLESIHEISLSSNKQILGGAAILMRKGKKLNSQHVIELMFREASAAVVRLRTKEKLNRSEKLYRSLAESTGQWIVRFNKAHQLVFVNAAFCESFERSKEENIGKTCDEIGLSEDYSKLIERNLKNIFQNRKPSKCEIKLDHRGKSDFYEWHFYPEFFEGSRKVESVLVNARNITQQKEEEGKLLDAISSKNRLYSIISHDLRSPFNAMVGFLDLLKNNYDDLSEEKRKKYIQIVQETSRNSMELLDSVLRWTSEYTSVESIKPAYFNLRSLVEKAVTLNKAAFYENELKAKVDVPVDLIVQADYNMIYTVVRNLITNAIKFSGKHGEICISAKEKKHKIILKVQDEGIGMSEKQLDDLLAGKKCDSISLKDGQKGFGLGLKFSRELIESNGGEIWIESEEGFGTSVYFSIPC